MVTRKNKYAGRCEVCRKWVTWDDFQVVHDLTVVSLRPAYDEAHKHHAPGCECQNTPIDDMVEDLLSSAPVCSKCWHETNAKHNLAEGALAVVRAGTAISERAQFVWRVVSR